MSESLDRAEVPPLSAEEILSRVLHRDGLMLVIDKPAGLPVHRGPKGGPNLEACFDALRFGLPRPPVLAHRLDKDTSGCLVLGRHRKATASLGLLFKHGKISKVYWAVVEGGPVEDEGTIDAPLGRLNAERGWWQKVDPQGQRAVTHWKVLGRAYFSPPPCGEGSGLGVSLNDNRVDPPPQPSPTRGEGADSARGALQFTWLAMEPVTGRTHQLRVHAAAQRWPIVGDDVYGTQASLRRLRNEKFVPRFGEPRLHLHSREIGIPISKNKPPVRVIAPAPEHMRERLRLCGWNGE